MPFTLLKATDIFDNKSGMYVQCCKIPIESKINVIGIQTFIKKNRIIRISLILPKTKIIPSLAQFKSAVNPLAIVLIKTLPQMYSKVKILWPTGESAS